MKAILLQCIGDAMVNGDVSPADENAPNRRCDVIKISGRKERCEAALEALQHLVPVSRTIEIPYDMHRYIIGQKGRDVRQMMDEHEVNISIPPADQHNSTVTVSGPVDNVEKALEALAGRIKDLEVEQKDRVRRLLLILTYTVIHMVFVIGYHGCDCRCKTSGCHYIIS